MTKPDMLLWLSDSRGVYIPRDFANSFADRAKNVKGVKDEQWKILEAGPEHEHYWDVWCEVEQSAIIVDPFGAEYTVYQNGDCWLVPKGMEFDHEADTFKWPEENDA